MSEVEDLHGRLVDLADSAGPWDDPLPQVRRRVESARGQAPATHRRWLASTNWGAVLAAAAVVFVVGLGGFVLTHQPGQSQKSASSAGQAPRAGGVEDSCGVGRSVGAPQVGIQQVGTLRLSAAGRFETGRRVTVQARFTAAAGSKVALGPLQVYVLSAGVVVGRLDPGAGVAAGPVPGGTASSLSANGVLRTADPADCTVGTGGASGVKRSPGTPLQTGQALPPGRYQLVATIGYQLVGLAKPAGAGTVVSDPLDITII